MGEQTARIIINFLQQLGMEITGKVEELVKVSYPIILRQVYAESIGELLFFFILLSIAYLCYKLTGFLNDKIDKIDRNEDTRRYYSEEDRMFYEIGRALSFLSVMLFAILSTIPLYDFIKIMINPHWYTAQKIFEMIQNGGM